MAGKIKKPRLSLRVRLTLLVCMEIVASILLALGLYVLIDVFFEIDSYWWLLLALIVFGLLIGTLITNLLSKWFFNPIKKIVTAMGQVAKGDFNVQLETKSSSKEIREMCAGFNLMAQELRATEILQTDFVSNVSHEFKTPINAIEGYATLLQNYDKLDEDQRQYVDKILFNTKRLSSLAGNILLLSRIDNQAIQTKQTRFRLDEQIRQSIVMLEPEWAKKDIEFSVDMEDVEFTGSENLMHHVWDNLIGNAIKFNPQGGLVRVQLTQTPGTIRFSVEDSGPGISEEAAKHIFDKFFQGDSSHKEEGNGLGLALAKKIVTISGGEIFAENIPGGCRFTVLLKTV
ncbi:MAG: HAMP domain-containing histidine kinase [Clostridia bacterium]|nr:HAMP domain-containing histidine kinase [Clostridia bacterium]